MALSRAVSEIFQCWRISRPWNPSQGSIKVTENGTNR